ncbi:Adenine deaminase [Dirofilaria immitis]
MEQYCKYPSVIHCEMMYKVTLCHTLRNDAHYPSLSKKEIFNIEPFSVPFHKDWSKDVGLVHFKILRRVL